MERQFDFSGSNAYLLIIFFLAASFAAEISATTAIDRARQRFFKLEMIICIFLIGKRIINEKVMQCFVTILHFGTT